ncbi:hypothetical protein H6F32_10450 [Anabaena sp. FACHB-1237]|uniref:COG1470 family protein n=1 Tax=Anabaena sp. FACHB-1237 TaxID=2692769 RepID=UPI0016815081|nr:hypothetical protein [Anabaena sp. FACHB-1237]MBD2137998.1 hypothetical protein [Anabaena sp. FACHB-1237]
MTYLTENQQTLLLSVITDPAGEIVRQSGEKLTLKVTVFNQYTEKNLLIRVKIDSIKDSNQRNLCELPPPQRIGLNAGNSGEVEFTIQIPNHALPGVYKYSLILDTDGTENPIIYERNLVIKSFVKSSKKEIDPTFTIKPHSTSSTPIAVEPGEKVNLTITVDNRSERVDKFRLICPDLNLIWRDFLKDNLQIKYINNNSNSRLFTSHEALELNPGEQGEILVELTVPFNSIAGTYSPTIRIYSDNHEQLTLLDLFYLKVKEKHDIDIFMITKIGKVQNLPGLYQIQIYNKGNTIRELEFTVESAEQQDQLCTYNPQTTSVKILPQQIEPQIVDIEVEPPKSWLKRPFYGRLFNFTVHVQDKQKIALINPRLSGVLIWEARPWWHFLILALIILALLTGTGLLIWWLFFKAKPSAEILQFYPENVIYKEIDNKPITLNWQVSEIKKVKNIKIVGLSRDGNITSAPITYNFEQGIPQELTTDCNIEKQILTCQNIITDARKAGKYNFEMQISYEQGKIIASKTQKTTQIIIEPIPQPEIITFKPSQSQYQEPEDNNVKNGIHLSWIINQINVNDQLQIKEKELSLTGKSANSEIKILVDTKKYCQIAQTIPKTKIPQTILKTLICENVPTNVINPGEYIFELAIVPKTTVSNQEPKIITQRTQSIKIQPIPTKIIDFKIDGQNVLPNYIFNLDPQQKKQLNISWQVKGTKNIKVELLPSPGTVANNGQIYYTLSPTNNKQTITLQVTNPTGEITSKSTVVETVLNPEKLIPEKANDLPETTLKTPPKLPEVLPSKTPNTLPQLPEQKNKNKPPRKTPQEIPEPPEKPENNILPPAELPPKSQ